MIDNYKTEQQFEQAMNICKDVYEKKIKDYGTAWRIMRTSSLTDQILIKAFRIRSFEQKGIQKIEENIENEYIGIVNYSIIALIQLELETYEASELEHDRAMELYNKYSLEAKNLMMRKNHDYDEIWRNMRISSYTDLILMKIYRTKQIEDNDGQTIVSEGVDANYFDMINYSVFALIKLNEFKNLS